MWRLGALLFVAWLGEGSEAGGPPALSVDAAPTLRCPAKERALAALERLLAPRSVVSTTQALGRFHLTLRPHGERGVGMTLRAGSGALLVDRAIDVAAHECEGLADTVALITAAWVRDQDSQTAEVPRERDDVHGEPVPAPAPAEPPIPEPAPPRTSRTPGAPPAPVPARPRGPAPAREATSSDEAPAPRNDDAREREAEEEAEPESKAEAEAQDDAPTPAAAESLEQPAAPTTRAPARHRLDLEAALGTTVSLDGLAVPTVTGRAGVEAGRNRLRLGLRGHAESARTLDAAGVVSVRHAQVELTSGAAFAESETLHGAVLLGAGIDVIAAEAASHMQRGVQRSFTPIGTLSLRAGLRAHQALDVFAAAELVVALRREVFTADGAPLAQTARSRTRLLVGVSWHVF